MKVAAGLIVAGLLLFGASLNDPFHFDDALITNDSNVTNPSRLMHFFNPLHLRQLTFFTFYLNHLAGGLSPGGFHAVNVALHIANAVLLFILLSRFVEQWVAIAAAAIFLVHPIQTEPVLYVYQRSILLACFFSLLGLIALAERKTWWAVLAFFLAFESKEASLAVPLAVAIFVPFFRQERTAEPQAADKRRALGFVVLVVALAALALTVLIDEKTVGLNTGINPFGYLLAQTRVFYTYLRLLVWPYPQSLEYDFQEVGGFLHAGGILVILGLALWRRSLPVLAFLILLAPTSSIIPSKDAAFEHRLYLPMLAFSLFAASLIARVPKRTWFTGALLGILAVLTLQRGTVWSSDIALWEDTAKHAPGKARVWFNLGGAYLATDPDKSRLALLRALELQPHFPAAFYDLGVIEQNKRNWSAALSYYQRALEQSPDYWAASNNLGNTLFSMGLPERSLEFFERTLRLNPGYWPAQYNIAIVHFMNGRYTEAVPRLRIVLDWRPDFREARYLLAMSFARTGNRATADALWKQLGEANAAESRHTPTMILAPSRP